MRRRWRWGVVGLLVACLAGLPAVVSAMPVNVGAVDPVRLLGKVARSAAQPYQGYSVAQGTFSLPTLPLAGDVPGLLSGTTYLRSWVTTPTRWRVDAIDPFSETDMHTDGVNAWLWDSTRQRSTPVRMLQGRVSRGRQTCFLRNSGGASPKQRSATVADFGLPR